MIAQLQSTSMTVEEYLQWEPQQELRYEFVWGQIRAMTGGTIPHNLISLNLYRAIRELVKHQQGRTFVSDVKVQVNEAGVYRYPDVLVSCDELTLESIGFTGAIALLYDDVDFPDPPD